jgi:cytochrome bd ubiquinol oxidase subunit II
VSGLSGLTALLATSLTRLHGHPALVRPLGALAVASILGGWGVAQYPYLLGTHLSIHAAAAPKPTMDALAVVTGLAVVLVGPSLVWLLVLTQSGQLADANS